MGACLTESNSRSQNSIAGTHDLNKTKKDETKSSLSLPVVQSCVQFNTLVDGYINEMQQILFADHIEIIHTNYSSLFTIPSSINNLVVSYLHSKYQIYAIDAATRIFHLPQFEECLLDPHDLYISGSYSIIRDHFNKYHFFKGGGHKFAKCPQDFHDQNLFLITMFEKWIDFFATQKRWTNGHSRTFMKHKNGGSIRNSEKFHSSVTFDGIESGYDSTIKVNIIHVEIGAFHSLFLCSKGIVYASGVNAYGQCGLGEARSSYDIEQPESIKYFTDNNIKIKSIHTKDCHSCCVSADNELWLFGNNSHGQCNPMSIHVHQYSSLNMVWIPHNLTQNLLKLTENDKIQKVELGASFTLFLGVDKVLYGIGNINVEKSNEVHGVGIYCIVKDVKDMNVGFERVLILANNDDIYMIKPSRNRKRTMDLLHFDEFPKLSSRKVARIVVGNYDCYVIFE